MKLLQSSFLLLVAMWAAAFGLRAQPQDGAEVTLLRPVNNAYMFTAGSAHLADTYLSPLKYSGYTLGLVYERTQAMKFAPERWRQQLTFALDFAHTRNPARTATMLLGNLQVSWGMMHRWAAGPVIFLGGGSSSIDAGVVYRRRNGNNPASARASWTVNLAGGAVWNVRIGRMPVCLRWQSTLPVAGVFFSPDYDELYYEIWLGNHRGLAHAAWWGNFLRWDNMLTADMALGRGGSRLRLGMSQRLLSTHVSNINSRTLTWSFVVGVTGDWISLSPSRRISPEAKTIYALY